jgi:peroxiredoxin
MDMPRLEVGQVIPEFTVRTADRENLSLHAMLKEQKKTVLWVLRYIGCTTCRYDVDIIAKNYAKFLEKGAQVLVVMQSDPAIVRRDLAGYDYPVQIICDQEQNIYKTLEIPATETKEQFISKSIPNMAKLAVRMAVVKASGFVHGDYEGNEQQLPALFILDDTGKVLYAHYASHFVDMPSLEEVLDLLP